MSIHLHNLTGCAPAPLAHYLKAVGVLRLVAAQADGNARGWWIGDNFRLATILDRDELERFFLHDYQPTPLISPWNGGSGFHPKDNKVGIEALLGSVGVRFGAYREQIERAIHQLGTDGELPKDARLRACASHWRGPLADWFAAAVAIKPDGTPGYPALLGTGGNDGRLDFTNNFMQNLARLFDMAGEAGNPLPGALESLRASLFRESAPKSRSARAIGQFFPGGAGGANAANGFDAKSSVNLFDYVLMLEGAVAFSAGLAKHCTAGSRAQTAAPFTVRSAAVGYGSGTQAEESARGEQWMPIWQNPVTYHELKATIAEGRCQVKRTPANRPLDFARAVARLGVARGIREFQRFGYIERNGQANLATPLGRWRVSAQPHQNLLDEICPWMDMLRRAGADKHAPVAIGRAARNCQEAAMGCCRSGDDAECWLRLLVALGEAEAQLLRSPRFTAEKRLGPIPKLSLDWIAAADDGSSEFRLALALAAQVAPAEKGGWNWRNPIRRHFLPLDRSGHRFHTTNDSLANDPNVVRSGDFEQTALDIVRRRLILGSDVGDAPFALGAARAVHASAANLAAFLDGNTDDARILALCHPLMALDFCSDRALSLRAGAEGERSSTRPLALFALLKLCHLPFPIPLSPAGSGSASGTIVRPDRAILARLRAGDLSTAVRVAIRRLAANGIRPHFTNACGDAALARRLGAALVFPVSPGLARAFACIVTQPFQERMRTATDSQPDPGQE